MKRRWIVYLIIGILFGAFDFYYLSSGFPWKGLFPFDSAGQIAYWVQFFVLNLGVWLVPVVPIVLYEAHLSRSRFRSTFVSIVVWCVAIVAYYLTNAFHLAFVGLPTRPEMHISNYGSEYFWVNWRNVFLGNILGGITEWIVVAIVGGAIVGLLASSIYLHFNKSIGVRMPY